ncbi:hypothetical protein SpCBS45565_g01223 [Spizellomyces sp. 'palustris']|nr:hypothetical protein SpCBS45565_g01223 [Spizellomyces sp. 'palustris']
MEAYGLDLDWCMAGCGRHTQNGGLYCSSSCLEQESSTSSQHHHHHTIHGFDRQSSFQNQDSSIDYYNSRSHRSSGQTIPTFPSTSPPRSDPSQSLLPFRNRGGLNYSLARPPSPQSPPQHVGHWGVWDRQLSSSSSTSSHRDTEF